MMLVLLRRRLLCRSIVGILPKPATSAVAVGVGVVGVAAAIVASTRR
jgi:hypothetical protein